MRVGRFIGEYLMGFSFSMMMGRELFLFFGISPVGLKRIRCDSRDVVGAHIGRRFRIL